jgi:hypothetical protein
VQVFGRKTKRNALARLAGQDSSWLRDSRLRQLFDADLEDGELILHVSQATATPSASFDRPVNGWVVATDRAIRLRWGLGTAVRQSLHVGFDRIRFVEVPVADPASAQVKYFDAARTTSGWYQELCLRADSTELTLALPHLLSAYERRLAERAGAEVASGGPAMAEAVPAQRAPLGAHASVSPDGKNRLTAGAHKRRRRRFAKQ